MQRQLNVDCVEKPRFSVRYNWRANDARRKILPLVRLTQAVAGGRASWAHQWHVQRQSRHADQQMRFSSTGRFRSYSTQSAHLRHSRNALQRAGAPLCVACPPLSSRNKRRSTLSWVCFGASARPRSVLQIRTPGAAADRRARTPTAIQAGRISARSDRVSAVCAGDLSNKPLAPGRKICISRRSATSAGSSDRPGRHPGSAALSIVRRASAPKKHQGTVRCRLPPSASSRSSTSMP